MRKRQAGIAMAEDREHFRMQPMDRLFLQRKFGGAYMLAARMRAQVNVNLRPQIEPHL